MSQRLHPPTLSPADLDCERQLLHLGHVLVTDKRFSVRKRSFAMDTLRDVEVLYHQRKWAPLFALLTTAACFQICGVSYAKSILELGALIFFLASVALFWNGGPRYSLAVATAEGVATPLTSSDRFLVENIAQVLQSSLQRNSARHYNRSQPIFRVLPGKAQRAASEGFSHPATAQAIVGPHLFSISSRVASKGAI